MLKIITIENFALINRTEIDLNDGFSVITGETGAGKSILLGALNFALGQRADSKVIKDEAKKDDDTESNNKKKQRNTDILKEIADQIKQKEEELHKIDDSLSGKTKISFFKKFNYDPDKLKSQSIDIANDLNILYRQKDNERIKRKVLTILEEPVVVADVLQIYYNFDYLKKDAFNKVGFDKEGHESFLKRCESFDEYAIKPTHIILETDRKSVV